MKDLPIKSASIIFGTIAIAVLFSINYAYVVWIQYPNGFTTL